MKKISPILFVLVLVGTLTLNISNNNKEKVILTMTNVEVLASENANKTVYCCSPYTSICVAGVTVPDVMGNKKESPCPN